VDGELLKVKEVSKNMWKLDTRCRRARCGGGDENTAQRVGEEMHTIYADA
jgi:hypothetical protein